MHHRDSEAARSYHEATKHSESRLRRDRHFLDFENQPIPFKLYPSLEPIPLVRDFPALESPALGAISAGGAGPALDEECVPDLSALSRLLYLSAGITKRKRHPGGEIYFRAYPNTGALYHIDVYLVCGDLPGLSAGVYHFGPHDFALRRLREGDYRAMLTSVSGAEGRITQAPLTLVTASTYWRNAWKYQARTYRHCFWDAGTLHANLLAVAGTERLGASVVMGFADRSVERLLGLDPAREGALTLVPLGHTESRPPAAPEAPELRLETEPLSRSEIDYPAIREIQAASSLVSGAEASAWSETTTKREVPAAQGLLIDLHPGADAELPADSLQSVILRRGSTRAFDRARSLSAQELATVLDRVTRGVAADFLTAPGASLIDLYLIVHAVDEVPSGAYYYRRHGQRLELLREGDFRAAAGRLGLFQELPADAAVNVYCLSDLREVLERFGNRGYRAAQLEGGILGGRLYLAAYAQRFGASGLTFLDDEVTEFFSPHARGKSVMFLAALGRSRRRR
jgi:SagB-type dehydrogenase family enzyme